MAITGRRTPLLPVSPAATRLTAGPGADTFPIAIPSQACPAPPTVVPQPLQAKTCNVCGGSGTVQTSNGGLRTCTACGGSGSK
ncbi:hypothetical protein [Planomonospora parontospora]|uniref:hypothetical protein n=1 Tax=Planomonospora parontospora TaxID=58119 RepID=UPI00166FA167|nr:hypothetical protein [Planomonospora parontospora]GGL53578.1 hypothetical protein GCM10014719_63600 [Planomonospora parontospora subsp. antibiotica]GII19599.1 hypothetical protein Ppa05_63250 [Planomonospora parontospora subsp. antibiotica]